MIDLLRAYSIEDIITFVFLLALAIKGSITFTEWAMQKIKQVVHREEEPQELKDHLKTQEEQITDLKEGIQLLAEKVDMLIESDRDDIKAYITEKHHLFVYKQGWIDDYSLNCIEQRYRHYKDQGGNSFIGGLMSQIRALPKQPISTE